MFRGSEGQSADSLNFKFLASSDSRWLSSITMILTTSPRKSHLPWAIKEKQLNFLTQVEVGKEKEIDTEEVINNFATRSSHSGTLSPQRPGHANYCREEGVQRFRTTMRPLWWFIQVLGMVPFRFCQQTGQYELSWFSWAAWRTIFTAVYVTALLAASVTGLVIVLSSGGSVSLDPDEDTAAIKLAGIILMMQCLVNAWIQLLCVIGTVRRLCSLMNSWCVYISILDALGQTMLLLPKGWTTLPAPLPLLIRLMTTLMCLHTFTLFKCCLFSFTINCHLLSNAIRSWNNLLAEAMDDLWKRTSGSAAGSRLAHLVHTHSRLVSLVRETEASYSLILQCYYGTAILTLCTELYIMAYRLGSKAQATEGMVTVGLLTLQTAVLFLEVSLAAAEVQEVRDELVTALTGPSICVTGGKFFIINRPFIITVISAVTTYFIVMMQFMQSSEMGSVGLIDTTRSPSNCSLA
ncbi:hypothetical protein O3P69_002623 [Scylla paramamosain]|uniref:Gustatory receptor n=1 Tax=Scylla paramamosain TaxID=85552 RepID=A0AAW0UMR5_SCYPA